MNIDEAIAITQERLAAEGDSMAAWLRHFRARISPILIGDAHWQRILDCAGNLPATMGALPFGFELPLHDSRPLADFGVSLASGTRAAAFFHARTADRTASMIGTLFREIDAEDSALRAIVGRKLMLEYDIGSAGEGGEGERPHPGVFLRPGVRPILGCRNQQEDIATVVDALVACVGWEGNTAEREGIERAYTAQPEGTRMDSFGVFPSRPRSIRLAVMGFGSQQALGSYLEAIGWPGRVDAVDAVIARFSERVNLVSTGANIDVRQEGIGPVLGLTLAVKQRYTEDARYWLDSRADWEPFLEALGDEHIVIREKLQALAGWASSPVPLFGKSGRYVLLRGIHHIKLVFCGDTLHKAKAYVFMVLSGAGAGAASA